MQCGVGGERAFQLVEPVRAGESHRDALEPIALIRGEKSLRIREKLRVERARPGARDDADDHPVAVLEFEMAADAESVARLEIPAGDELVQAGTEHSACGEMQLGAQFSLDAPQSAYREIDRLSPAARLELYLRQSLRSRDRAALGVFGDAGGAQDVRHRVAWNAAQRFLKGTACEDQCAVRTACPGDRLREADRHREDAHEHG